MHDFRISLKISTSLQGLTYFNQYASTSEQICCFKIIKYSGAILFKTQFSCRWATATRKHLCCSCKSVLFLQKTALHISLMHFIQCFSFSNHTPEKSHFWDMALLKGVSNIYSSKKFLEHKLLKHWVNVTGGGGRMFYLKDIKLNAKGVKVWIRGYRDVSINFSCITSCVVLQSNPNN